ncbi:RHS repeat-associated core domain-containing protein [Pseudoalteromonas rhizosphaerae]|uniref:RHS repeat-associated core domain-containing protein n=1 Tax=Pseudoalteromonas rhizosphaerae TaxID=2518973 RepID=UPI0038508119
MSVDGQSFVLDYAYNSNGYLTNTIYPSGANIAYLPNAIGQASQVANYSSNASYFANGMVKSHRYGNGFTHTATQTSSGLPATFYDVRSGSYALNHGFSYDANSNITGIDDKVNNAYDLSLTYDGLNRLDIISDSYLGAGGVNYDAMGNITYYKLGNQALTYYYHASKQLDYVTGSRSYDFSYDDKGNVTDNGKRGFVYNTAAQLVESDGYSYTYDGNNKRVKEVGSTGISYSLYASNGKLMYRQVDGEHVDYYYLGGKLVAKKKSATVSYLHADYLGSTAAESTTSGVVTSRMHYQPFGESIEAPKDDVSYTGHKFDTDLGLSYMQARYYDPVIGLFYSNDPVGFTNIHNFNRYAYANNNPYKYTDPDGKDASLYPKDKAVADPSDLVKSSPKFEFKLKATIENKMETVEQADNMESTKEAVTNTTLAVSSAALTYLAPPAAPYITAAGIAAAATGGVEPVHKGDVFKTEVSLEATSLTEEPKIEVKTTQEHNHDN